MTRADEVRIRVAEKFGGLDVQFRVKDVLTSVNLDDIDWQGSERSSAVASAIRSWDDSNLIVRGFHVKNHSGHGQNRIYSLYRAGDNSFNDDKPKAPLNFTFLTSLKNGDYAIKGDDGFLYRASPIE